MENNIIELRNWFRENGKMDFELHKNLPKTEQGKTITYNCKDIDNIFESVLSNYKIHNTENIDQLKTRIKELEQTIENNVTEVSEFFNDGVEIFECNSCGMLMEENEPYNNYCPNCGRKIKK